MSDSIFIWDCVYFFLMGALSGAIVCYRRMAKKHDAIYRELLNDHRETLEIAKRYEQRYNDLVQKIEGTRDELRETIFKNSNN